MKMNSQQSTYLSKNAFARLLKVELTISAAEYSLKIRTTSGLKISFRVEALQR